MGIRVGSRGPRPDVGVPLEVEIIFLDQGKDDVNSVVGSVN